MFRLLHSHHQIKIDHSLGTKKVCTPWDPIEYTLSMYLDYVLFWPDDGFVAAETCCPDDNYRVLI